MKKNIRKNQAKSVGKTLGVYAKKAFGSPKSVVEYLGRYTHKIAISNQRIRKIDAETVTFSITKITAKKASKSRWF